MFRRLCGLGVCLIVLGFVACSDQSEKSAEDLYKLANRYTDKGEYSKAVEILQKIRINYEKTEFANLAEKEITQYEELQKLQIANQTHKINTSFASIGRALENYKVRFLAYPLTPSDLEKLPAVVIPEWEDVWGNLIFYKPIYSSPDVPKHTPDGYVLASFGEDGLPGGTGEDQDHFFKNGKAVDNFLVQ